MNLILYPPWNYLGKYVFWNEKPPLTIRHVVIQPAMQRCWSMSPLSGAGHEYFRHLLMSVLFPMAYKAWKDRWTSPHTLVWAKQIPPGPWSEPESSSWWSPAAAAHGCGWPAPKSPRWRRAHPTSPLKPNRRKTWWDTLEMTLFCAFGVLFVCLFVFSVLGHGVFLCCSFCQIDALQEVLEKLRSKEMPLEKKLGWLPSVCISSWVVWKGTVNGEKERTSEMSNKAESRMFCWYTHVVFTTCVFT